MSEREKTKRRDKGAVGRLFEHKYLSQLSECQGADCVESAHLSSAEERKRGGRGRKWK